MIKKFEDFVLESRKTKDKGSLVDLLVKLLSEKPEIKLKSPNYPTEKGAYSLAGMKSYFKSNGKTNAECDEAFYQMGKSKTLKVGDFAAKNFYYDEGVPYFYMDLSKDDIQKIKDKYEKESENQAKPIVDKRKEQKKVAAASAKAKKERKQPKKGDKKAPRKTSAKTPERAQKKK